MGYRPITDIWFLARAKLRDGRRYYGAYLGGFPERARALLGCRLDQPVLHVCGGMAKHYPYSRGFGPRDKTLDLAISTEPDFLRDAREPFPHSPAYYGKAGGWDGWAGGWAGILMDPPYSREDASHYSPGSDAYPSPEVLLRNAMEVLPPGGRAGIIHYMLPRPPKNSVFVAAVGVLCGFNNRVRVYSVFEKALERE